MMKEDKGRVEDLDKKFNGFKSVYLRMLNDEATIHFVKNLKDTMISTYCNSYHDDYRMLLSPEAGGKTEFLGTTPEDVLQKAHDHFIVNGATL